MTKQLERNKSAKSTRAADALTARNPYSPIKDIYYTKKTTKKKADKAPKTKEYDLADVEMDGGSSCDETVCMDYKAITRKSSGPSPSQSSKTAKSVTKLSIQRKKQAFAEEAQRTMRF